MDGEKELGGPPDHQKPPVLNYRPPQASDNRAAILKRVGAAAVAVFALPTGAVFIAIAMAFWKERAGVQAIGTLLLSALLLIYGCRAAKDVFVPRTASRPTRKPPTP
jgi:hypothetical protein